MSEIGSGESNGAVTTRDQRSDPSEDSFQWEEGFTDLNLKVEDRTIAVNKGFLMTVSPVFKRMLLSDFREKNATEINLPEKKYAEMVVFLQFLMQEKNPEMTDERTDFLIPLAAEYQTSFPMTRCENYLVKRYFVQKAVRPTRYQLLKFILYGQRFDYTKLEIKAKEYLIKYRFKDIEKDEIFSSLPTEYKLELYHDRLNAVEKKYSGDSGNLKSHNDVML